MSIVVQVLNELMTNRENCVLYNSSFVNTMNHTKNLETELLVAKSRHWELESINEFLNETKTIWKLWSQSWDSGQ